MTGTRCTSLPVERCVS